MLLTFVLAPHCHQWVTEFLSPPDQIAKSLVLLSTWSMRREEENTAARHHDSSNQLVATRKRQKHGINAPFRPFLYMLQRFKNTHPFPPAPLQVPLVGHHHHLPSSNRLCLTLLSSIALQLPPRPAKYKCTCYTNEWRETRKCAGACSDVETHGCALRTTNTRTNTHPTTDEPQRRKSKEKERGREGDKRRRTQQIMAWHGRHLAQEPCPHAPLLTWSAL